MFIGDNAQNGPDHLQNFATTSKNLSTFWTASNNKLLQNNDTSAESLIFATTSKAIIFLQENSYQFFQNTTITAATNINATTATNSAGGLLQMRLALTLTHILLVSLGNFILKT